MANWIAHVIESIDPLCAMPFLCSSVSTSPGEMYKSAIGGMIRAIETAHALLQSLSTPLALHDITRFLIETASTVTHDVPCDPRTMIHIGRILALVRYNAIESLYVSCPDAIWWVLAAECMYKLAARVVVILNDDVNVQFTPPHKTSVKHEISARIVHAIRTELQLLRVVHMPSFVSDVLDIPIMADVQLDVCIATFRPPTRGVEFWEEHWVSSFASNVCVLRDSIQQASDNGETAAHKALWSIHFLYNLTQALICILKEHPCWDQEVLNVEAQTLQATGVAWLVQNADLI